MRCNTYILTNESNTWFKIGMSKDVEERLRQLQTGAQEKWVIYDHVSVATRSAARIIENLGKIRFRCFAEQINGEVYKISKEKVDSFLFEVKTKLKEQNPHWDMIIK